MARRFVFATVAGAAALTLALTTAVQAVPVTGAPASGAVTSAPTKISPDDYGDFQAGVESHRLQMEGAEQTFNMYEDGLRQFAKDITPLIGNQDPNAQAALEAQISTLNNHIQTIDTWGKMSKGIFDKACNRFLNMHLSSWTKAKERQKMTRLVEDMRDAYHQFFDKDVAALQAAGRALADKDVQGFWDHIALVDGGVAFTMRAFTKAQRGLANMG